MATHIFSDAEVQRLFPQGFRVPKHSSENRFRAWHRFLGNRSRSWTLYGERGALGRLAHWAWQKEAFFLERPVADIITAEAAWVTSYPVGPF